MPTEESDKAGHMSGLWSESIYVHCTQLVVTLCICPKFGTCWFHRIGAIHDGVCILVWFSVNLLVFMDRLRVGTGCPDHP